MIDIPLLAFEALDSTSDKASQLLAGERHPPFAVWARSQLKGRGQRGRQWISPAGNLYLTIAVPATALGVENRALLPIKAATLVAAWLEESLGLRISLKWPNDLYFAGRKLGGILCESSFSGQEWGPLLVGIGLNISSSPLLSEHYESIALADIKDKAWDIHELAKSLCSYWGAHWCEKSEKEVLTTYRRYHLGIGQLWKSRSAHRSIYREEGIDEEGRLLLRPYDINQKQLGLTSASHDFSWLFQTSQAESIPLLIADIGNTATKLAFYHDRRDKTPAYTGSFLSHLPEQGMLSEHLARMKALLAAELGFSPSYWPLYVCSVNDAAKASVARQAENHGLRLETIEKRRVLSWGEHYRFSNLGMDRLAMIEAWLASLSPQQRGEGRKAALIVSLGTASTLDLVRASGEHLGGYIVPGLQTSLDAMASKAELLPSLSFEGAHKEASRHGLGQDTSSAMLWGVLQMTVAFIERVRHSAISDYHLSKNDLELCLTGGFSSYLQAFIPEAQSQAYLALDGIRVLCLGGNLFSVKPEQADHPS